MFAFDRLFDAVCPSLVVSGVEFRVIELSVESRSKKFISSDIGGGNLARYALVGSGLDFLVIIITK